MLPYHCSSSQPLLFVNHHNFGDGLLQLGALQARQRKVPQEVLYYTAGDPRNATWLREIVMSLDWLEWWSHPIEEFPGPVMDLHANGARTLRGTWATLMGVCPEEVVPIVSSVWREQTRFLAKTLIACPDSVTNQHKAWPRTQWHELVELATQAGYICFSMASSTCEPLQGCQPLSGLSVRDAVRWLASAELVVTVDTGLKWLAWAAGQRRMVEVYNPEANGAPWSELGPPWTMEFTEARPELVWRRVIQLGEAYSPSLPSSGEDRGQPGYTLATVVRSWRELSPDTEMIATILENTLADFGRVRTLEIVGDWALPERDPETSTANRTTITVEALNALPSLTTTRAAELWLPTLAQEWPGQPFEAIVLVDCFDQLEYPGEQLASLAHLLTSDGRLLLSSRNARHLQRLEAMLTGHTLDDGAVHYRQSTQRYHLDDVVQLLRQAGFSVESQTSFSDDDFTTWESSGRSCVVSLDALGEITVSQERAEECRMAGFVMTAIREAPAAQPRVEIHPPPAAALPLPAPSERKQAACYAGLHEVQDTDAYLRKVYRRLADEDRAWVTVPNGQYATTIQQLLAGEGSHGGDTRWAASGIRYFSRPLLERLFYRNGLEITRVSSAVDESWVEVPRRDDGGSRAILDEALNRDLRTHHFHLECRRRKLTEFGRTSIIMLTHNQLEFTRRCVTSLRLCTPEPYELIVIDNASSDGTREFLKQQADVRLLANPANVGFPVACNQAINIATGENILLLNNDTLVTTGWLHRLLRALYFDASIGLVGPSTNQTVGVQKLLLDPPSLRELDRFAWEWGRQHDGEWFEAFPLIGFCLLFRRSLTEEIGLLDERFGLGTWEDYDYCTRAVAAGYRCVYAADAYVHHFGSATISTLGSAVDELLAENQVKYFEKWADTCRNMATGKEP